MAGNQLRGKTTFSRRVAQFLGIPHIELDALYSLPNNDPEWAQLTRMEDRRSSEAERFLEALAAVAKGGKWYSVVMAGEAGS